MSTENVAPATKETFVAGPDTVRCTVCGEFEHCAFAQCDAKENPLCTDCAKKGTQRWDPKLGFMVTTL